MSVQFTENSATGRRLMNWWKGLNDDRASRAELKRCSSPLEVMMTRSFNQLCHSLQDIESVNTFSLALIVGVLSHLDNDETVLNDREHNVELVAKQLAKQHKGEKPLYSELRFRRLIQRQQSDLFLPMLRVVKLLKGKVNLYGLAESIYYWGDDIKKRWAYAYFE